MLTAQCSGYVQAFDVVFDEILKIERFETQ